MRRLTLLVIAGLLAVPTVVGCSSSDTSDTSVHDRLAAAKKSFDDAGFIGFELSSADLPDDVNALESADGTGTHAPAFSGTVQIHKGLSFDAGIRAVNGDVYAELPFVGWTKIDPADYGAPDPAALMDKQTGVSSLLTETADAGNSGSERSGSQVLTKISGTLAGSYVHALFSSAAETTFKVTFTLTSDNVLHSVSLTGPFYGDHGDNTYTIDFDLTADPVTVTPPA